MIQRYNMEIALSDFGNDHGLKRIVESNDGGWVKYEDVEEILQTKIDKLNIKDNDVIIITPPEGAKWSEEKCYKYYKLINEALKRQYSNLTFTFSENVKLEVKDK